MPFTMIHLAVAKAIQDKATTAGNLPSFYLGAIAPDCIHVRTDYNSSMKKASHLCVGDERWGEITNNAAWSRNVLDFLRLKRNSGDMDFYVGYGIHILADIRWNEKIYMPFKQKYLEEARPVQERGFAIYNDCSQIDFALYKICPWRQEVFSLLKEAGGTEIPGMVHGNDTEIWREQTISQYDGGTSPYDQPIRYVRLQDALDFIESAAEDILVQVRGALSA